MVSSGIVPLNSLSHLMAQFKDLIAVENAIGWSLYHWKAINRNYFGVLLIALFNEVVAPNIDHSLVVEQHLVVSLMHVELSYSKKLNCQLTVRDLSLK